MTGAPGDPFETTNPRTGAVTSGDVGSRPARTIPSGGSAEAAMGGTPVPGEVPGPSAGRMGGEPGSAPPAADGTIGEDGEDLVLRETIVVGAGELYDGRGARYLAGPELGDGGQFEGQQPLFLLEDGAQLHNVVLGVPAADGIHCYGDAELHNIIWEDIGEDALTVKAPGTVLVNGGSARDGEGKVFQINAPSTFIVSDFKATDAQTFIRQDGGTTFQVDVVIDHCDISHMVDGIFRTDSALSTVHMTDTRYSMVGVAFPGVRPFNIALSGNVAY